ncbi:hypothetical protein AMJ82_08210 [candidate division TA06 bacterium SM23_40]|uniref:Uncharacterized protein n=1 Tax=candidate division TA06 bacterium SM23_40 TaxID=1703774 RepID=A0A0S8G798_UNCT6|nr:MAG: hypothetical protein AMJ82_08210 [candidate division TA06 bacterium SM23_40]
MLGMVVLEMLVFGAVVFEMAVLGIVVFSPAVLEILVLQMAPISRIWATEKLRRHSSMGSGGWCLV